MGSLGWGAVWSHLPSLRLSRMTEGKVMIHPGLAQLGAEFTGSFFELALLLALSLFNNVDVSWRPLT